MEYLFWGGFVAYRTDGTFARHHSVDGRGGVQEDDTPDNGSPGTVNDILEVGEEIIWSNTDWDDVYIGYVTIAGIDMPVYQDTNGAKYVVTPEGTKPTDIDPNFVGDAGLAQGETGPSVYPTTLLDSDIIPVAFNILTGEPVCFSEGTRIATPQGDVAVEDLTLGDLIKTDDGRTVPVKWVGRQTLRKAFLGPKMQLVRIRAGAFGHGVPHSDLTVTADHGMVIDGYVINASALVNHDTIDFLPLADMANSVTVYHIETEAHDVILANGAASETFVDAVGRAAFDNYQEYLDLYGAERVICEMSLPRISARRLVPPTIQSRLGAAEPVTGFEHLLTA